MIKLYENHKEKLNKFLKADVLAECRSQVDYENRVVLCVLNIAMVCLSFLLAFPFKDVCICKKSISDRRTESEIIAEGAANEAKTNFLAGMSHEIRTPMNAIIGLNSMIRSSIDDRNQVLDYTEKLDSASRYLLTLLNDILDMSRIESGNMKLAVRAFSGDKFWDNVNMLAKTQALMAGVGYSFDRERKISEVYIGDATRLEQIMINLINNAVKFTPEGGSVDVAVTEQEVNERVQLTTVVSDNGIGIAKDFLPKVFDIFTQQHEENTSVYGGSGLGLSIAHNYARMMDGDITVQSTEGEGTVFTVTVKPDFDRRKKSGKKKQRISVLPEREYCLLRIIRSMSLWQRDFWKRNSLKSLRQKMAERQWNLWKISRNIILMQY